MPDHRTDHRWENWGHGTPPGADLVLEALRTLDDVPPLSDTLLDRPWELVEVFFDHADKFPLGDRLFYITEFLATYFDRVTHQVTTSWLLMLSVRVVSDESMARIFSQHRTGRRVQPFSRWARAIVEEVCENGRFDSEYFSVQPKEDDPRKHALAVNMARLLNALDMPWRRVAWLSWVEYRSPVEVVRHTGLPLEQVEHMLEQINQQSIDEFLGAAREQRPDEPGSDAFWEAMGLPGDDDEGGGNG